VLVGGDGMRGLEDLRRRMNAVATGGLRELVKRNCAEASVKILDDEFRTSTDPYGNRWPALTSRQGMPLLDTGTHLRATLTPKVTPAGFEVSTHFIGAAVHQYGATIRPVRAKKLAFKVRGAPTKRSPRGKLSGTIFADEVTIPRRQYMPEGDAGPRWTRGLNDAATDMLMLVMGGDF
jgi:phage gpG-like protein